LLESVHKNRYYSPKKIIIMWFVSIRQIWNALFHFLIQVTSQDAIFRVVASILHLGNIDFAKGKEIDSSVPKDDKSKFHLNTTAELLM